MMQRCVGGDSDVVYDMVTGDESWIYCYDPEAKGQSAHRDYKESSTNDSISLLSNLFIVCIPNLGNELPAHGVVAGRLLTRRRCGLERPSRSHELFASPSPLERFPLRWDNSSVGDVVAAEGPRRGARRAFYAPNQINGRGFRTCTVGVAGPPQRFAIRGAPARDDLFSAVQRPRPPPSRRRNPDANYFYYFPEIYTFLFLLFARRIHFSLWLQGCGECMRRGGGRGGAGEAARERRALEYRSEMHYVCRRPTPTPPPGRRASVPTPPRVKRPRVERAKPDRRSLIPSHLSLVEESS
ncbi:hypothetical protein EVAR_95392_1 [Eumeta japonica]|uniref:Uncharacterized protein n=1 Tax=Eumeta variegata TaxID=151549 RepID=A0A4C1VJB9_EUMVA|nr:hypothetical protein EVAR_95392_1 [Eumeta japonica]